MSFNPVYDVSNIKGIEKVTVLDNWQPSDTNGHAKEIDISKYNKLYVVVDKNNLDAEIMLFFRIARNAWQKVWDGESWKDGELVTISEKEQGVFHINSIVPFLNEIVSDKIVIRYQSNKVTTGTLGIFLYGVRY